LTGVASRRLLTVIRAQQSGRGSQSRHAALPVHQHGTRRDDPYRPLSPAGDSGRERHGGGDEIVEVVDGTATLHLLTDAGPQSISINAGMMLIVPQGMWHRFYSPDGVTLITATPQPTDHPAIDVEDPRTLE